MRRPSACRMQRGKSTTHFPAAAHRSSATWFAPRIACRAELHRDRSIRLPYAQVIATSPEGIPYLAPQIVLLFKARHHRPKDQADFTGALPLLNPARRSWLAAALARVHPGHPWISELQRRA